mmetsp:Transcript_13610/g.33386  ORF Transcript_13610/g.33386 Transcript_13610/m.33386 type:complete len:326 (-) Transcript_13610:1551-2528(-)
MMSASGCDPVASMLQLLPFLASDTLKLVILCRRCLIEGESVSWFSRSSIRSSLSMGILAQLLSKCAIPKKTWPLRLDVTFVKGLLSACRATPTSGSPGHETRTNLRPLAMLLCAIGTSLWNIAVNRSCTKVLMGFLTLTSCLSVFLEIAPCMAEAASRVELTAMFLDLLKREKPTLAVPCSAGPGFFPPNIFLANAVSVPESALISCSFFFCSETFRKALPQPTHRSLYDGISFRWKIASSSQRMCTSTMRWSAHCRLMCLATSSVKSSKESEQSSQHVMAIADRVLRIVPDKPNTAFSPNISFSSTICRTSPLCVISTRPERTM